MPFFAHCCVGTRETAAITGAGTANYPCKKKKKKIKLCIEYLCENDNHVVHALHVRMREKFPLYFLVSELFTSPLTVDFCPLPTLCLPTMASLRWQQPGGDEAKLPAGTHGPLRSGRAASSCPVPSRRKRASPIAGAGPSENKRRDLCWASKRTWPCVRFTSGPRCSTSTGEHKLIPLRVLSVSFNTSNFLVPNLAPKGP